MTYGTAGLPVGTPVPFLRHLYPFLFHFFEAEVKVSSFSSDSNFKANKAAEDVVPVVSSELVPFSFKGRASCNNTLQPFGPVLSI